MAKKKTDSPTKNKVKLGLSDLSVNTRVAVYALCGMFNGMSVDDVLKNVKLIKKECGGDALVEITINDYYDSSPDILWHRMETDKEFNARLAKNKKIAAMARKNSKAKAKQKVLDEKAELARLQKKYSKE